jgi:hypothetical protein
MHLLRQLTNMMYVASDVERLPPFSPFMETVLFCLGRMFGDERHPDSSVALVARFQFATRRCLDGPSFCGSCRPSTASPGAGHPSLSSTSSSIRGSFAPPRGASMRRCQTGTVSSGR